MTAHAVRFGAYGTSSGVAVLPDAARDAGAAPCVLLLNAGLLRHAGPHRLHVQLARQLARAGLASLRFDLSRIGDSGTRRDRLARDESVVQETREAMDFMADSYGARRFVLFGICSGADQAVRTALADDRVHGLVLVDGYAYRTRGYLLQRYSDRALRPRSWWNLLSFRHPGYSRLTTLFRRSAAPADAPDARPAGPRLGVYDRPPREVAEERLRSLVERGCRLHLAYTPSRHFNRLAQFGEMFPSLAGDERVRVEYFQHANHMFTLLANQRALVERVESWLQESYPDHAPEPGRRP